MLYTNGSDEDRVWPTLKGPGGFTLELAAGEEVALELPAGFTDVHLKPKAVKAKPQADKKEQTI